MTPNIRFRTIHSEAGNRVKAIDNSQSSRLNSPPDINSLNGDSVNHTHAGKVRLRPIFAEDGIVIHIALR
ncbi:MAG: hypothetical protein P8179_13555 [Candidatus Thiodiazotropha sp.]